MSATKITLLVFAICIIACIIVVVVCLEVRKRRFNIVKANSQLYDEILKLNSAYNFYSDFYTSYTFSENCSSKRKLENLSIYDVLISKIDSDTIFFEELILRVQKNRKDYKLYCNQYNNLSSKMDQNKIRGLKIKLKTFLKIENNLCNKIKLTPQLYTEIHIEARYSSPQGRNSYHKDDTFQYEQIVEAYKDYLRLKRQQKVYSNNVKIERAMMSDSLRYDILKRDGFRCQICGATAKEGAKLHVDHIVPVSKGGKTVASNLRTLCDRCNLGKSDKLE